MRRAYYVNPVGRYRPQTQARRASRYTRGRRNSWALKTATIAARLLSRVPARVWLLLFVMAWLADVWGDRA